MKWTFPGGQGVMISDDTISAGHPNIQKTPWMTADGNKMPREGRHVFYDMIALSKRNNIIKYQQQSYLFTYEQSGLILPHKNVESHLLSWLIKLISVQPDQT